MVISLSQLHLERSLTHQLYLSKIFTFNFHFNLYFRLLHRSDFFYWIDISLMQRFPLLRYEKWKSKLKFMRKFKVKSLDKKAIEILMQTCHLKSHKDWIQYLTNKKELTHCIFVNWEAERVTKQLKIGTKHSMKVKFLKMSTILTTYLCWILSCACFEQIIGAKVILDKGSLNLHQSRILKVIEILIFLFLHVI